MLLCSFVFRYFAIVFETWKTDHDHGKNRPTQAPPNRPMWIFRPWIFRCEFLISPHVNFHPWIFRTHGWIFILFLLRGFLGLNPHKFLRIILLDFIDRHLGMGSENSQPHNHPLCVVNHLFLRGIPICQEVFPVAENIVFSPIFQLFSNKRFSALLRGQKCRWGRAL